MTRSLVLITSFSIILPAIIGWVRLKKTDPTYFPFLLCIWVGLINEILSYIFSRTSHSNAVNSNIYVLIESILILWQFENWRSFGRTRFPFFTLVILFSIFWGVENFYISRITSFSSYFRIVYSFAISLLAINYINKIIVRERTDILKNPAFLICAGFIVYYLYKVLVEAFWVYGLNNSSNFRIHIYIILAWINLSVNLIYALSVLWMPTKHQFTLPS